MVTVPTVPQGSVTRLHSQYPKGIGFCGYDVPSGTVHWDDQVRNIWGIQENESETYATLLSAVHPEDRARLEEAAKQAIDPAGDGRCFAEFRVINKLDGITRSVQAVGQASFENGRAVRLTGVIHERREAQLRLQGRMLEQVSDAVIVTGNDLRITFWNAAAAERYGVSASEALGKPLADVYSFEWSTPEDQSRAWAELETAGHWRGENVHVSKAGRKWVVESSVTVLKDEAGQATGLLAVIRDITDHRRREQHLRESEDRFRTLANNIAPLAWMANADGGVFWYNQRWYEYTGTSLDTIQGWGWQKVHHPDHVDRVVEKIRRSFELGEPWEDTFPLRAKNGEYRWFLSRAMPIRDNQGQVVRWFGTNSDITEQLETERKLRASEAHYRALAEQIADGIFIADRRGRYVDANLAACNALGYSRDELMQLSIQDVIAPEERSRLPEQFLALAAGDLVRNEWRFRRKDGSEFIGELVGRQLPDGNYQGVVRDVTERRRAESALQESEERFRLTFENAAVGMAHVALNGRWLRVNQRACEITGYPKDELMRLKFEDITHPEDIEADWSLARRLIAGEISSYHLEKRYIRKDRKLCWVNLTVSLRRDASGAPAHFISVLEDITARKEAERALHENQAFLKRITDVAPAILYLIDLEQLRTVWVSRSISNVLGYTPEQLGPLETTLFGDLLHPEDQARYPEHLERLRALRSGESARWEFRMRHVDGSWRWLSSREMVYECEPNGTVRQIIGAVEDIHERKSAELALASSEHRFRAVFENIATGIAISTRDGKFAEVNQAYCDLLGYKAEELRGRYFWSIIHPDDVAQNDAQVERLYRGEIPAFEIENRYVRKNGSPVWVRKFISLFRDENAGSVRSIALVTDMTVTKRTEAALRRSNQDLERFAYLAGHDLQEPLRMVTSYSQFLARRYQDKLDAEALEFIGYIVDGTRRMAQLIKDLLTYARFTENDELELPPTNLNEALSAALADLEGVLAESGARVTADPLPVVPASESLIARVFQNLISNAVKYRRPDTPPEINISAQPKDFEWVISVKDNGQGIRDQDQHKVFDLFVRLQDRSVAGTGIGLASVKRIVERHGGRVWLESQFGKGSIFYFTLPMNHG